MKLKTITPVIGALVCMLTAPALSQSSKDWIDVKGEKDLRALFSNKTHRGTDYVSHHRDDGKSVVIFGDTKTPIAQTWTVKGNDQVCITSNVSVSCYRFHRNRKKPNDIKATFVTQPVSSFFTLEEGIPKF